MTVKRTILDFKNVVVPWFLISAATAVCKFVTLNFTSPFEDCVLALVLALLDNPKKEFKIRENVSFNVF